MQLFKGISMVLEYYGRRSNTFMSEDVAEEYGMSSLRLNGGRIYNEGVEFSMNLTPFKRKDFVWTIGLNASKNWNKSQNDDVTVKVNKLTKNDFLNGSGQRPLKKGYPLRAFWSYSFAGLNPENGYPEFNLLDVEETDPEIDPTTFLVYSGQSDPYFTGGFNTSVRYKSLQLSAYFSALIGAKKRLPNPYANFSSGKLPKVPASVPAVEVKPFEFSEAAPLFANLPAPKTDASIRTMEEYDQGFGSILYRTELPELADGVILTVSDPHDYAQIFVDGKYTGTLDRRNGERELAGV